MATSMVTFAYLSRYRFTLGSLLFLILFGIFLTVLVWLIERNYHEDSESRIFSFGSLVGVLGVIGGVIGQAVGGIGGLIGYFYIFAVVGGYLASDYFFDYDFKRRVILCLLTPTILAICWIVGQNFDQWFHQSMMK